jgi:hypothetical protein
MNWSLLGVWRICGSLKSDVRVSHMASTTVMTDQRNSMPQDIRDGIRRRPQVAVVIFLHSQTSHKGRLAAAGHYSEVNIKPEICSPVLHPAEESERRL